VAGPALARAPAGGGRVHGICVGGRAGGLAG
jgi:hypothetical protein